MTEEEIKDMGSEVFEVVERTDGEKSKRKMRKGGRLWGGAINLQCGRRVGVYF